MQLRKFPSLLWNSINYCSANTWQRENSLRKPWWMDRLQQSREKSTSLTSSGLVSSGCSHSRGGKAQVNRCEQLALYKGYTYTQVQRCWSPGSGPLARGSSLPSSSLKSFKPCSYAGRLCPFLLPASLLPLPYLNLITLLLDSTFPRLLFYGKLFLSPIIIFFFPADLYASFSGLSHLHLSLISTPLGLLFSLPPTLLQCLWGGPESSGCSTRMSDSHILTFRQPGGPGRGAVV